MRLGWLGLSMCAALCGCAAGSGVIPVGPDTYTLSELRAPAAGGGPAARQAAVSRSAAFCRAQGRAVVPLELRPDGDPTTPYWPTAFDATFRCAAVGDPAVATQRQ